MMTHTRYNNFRHRWDEIPLHTSSNANWLLCLLIRVCARSIATPALSDCLPRQAFIRIIHPTATAAADDPDLTLWVKLPHPLMDPPPRELRVSCCRDPYCMLRPAAAGGAGEYWVLLLGSGLCDSGGAVLRFCSRHLTHSRWQCVHVQLHKNSNCHH